MSSASRRLRGNWSSLRETTGTAARQRHGDACWHRRREAAAARAEQEMEAMAFLLLARISKVQFVNSIFLLLHGLK